MKEKLSEFVYEDLSCLALEIIEKKETNIDNQLKKKISKEIPRLRDAGFLFEYFLRLTQKGKNHLQEAINSARDENRSGLSYTGMLMGFTLAFFGLLMIGVNYKNNYALLFIYLLCCLFVSIFTSLLGGFCFWHGCSRDHGWEELRVLNEMGDSLITFSGWILLYTVYLALFLNLSQAKFPIEIPSHVCIPISLSTIYFLIPGAVNLIMVSLSWRASKRNGIKPENIRSVIYDFFNTSTYLLNKGKRFYEEKKRGEPLGWFILVMLSIGFSAIPIIIVTSWK